MSNRCDLVAVSLTIVPQPELGGNRASKVCGLMLFISPGLPDGSEDFMWEKSSFRKLDAPGERGAVGKALPTSMRMGED